MTTTIQPGALTTLARLKSSMRIVGASADDDGLIEAVNVATAMIERYCGRTFARAALVDERYPAQGGLRLCLTRTPIVSIESIDLDGVIDASGYVVESAEAGIVYFRSSMPRRGVTRPGISQDLHPGTSPPDLLVSYTAGYVTPEQADVGGAYAGDPITLPADLERAAKQLAGHVFASPPGFVGGFVASERLGDASIAYRADADEGSSGAIPSPIRAALSAFRRVAIA